MWEKNKIWYCQSIFDSFGDKLLSCLRLKSSHLNEHKFQYGFGYTINTMCACGNEVETTEHLPWHCHLYSPRG